MATTEFVMDLEEIRKLARQQMGDGAVTENYKADKAKVIELLSSALATEWICVLRYTQHQIVAEGIHAETVASHFGEHAEEERRHAMALANRIKMLGGTPSLDPATLQKRAHSEYKEADSLAEMIKENLYAERVAIDTYSRMVRYVGDEDATTRRLLEHILEKEEEHADELADLLAAFDPREKSTH